MMIAGCGCLAKKPASIGWLEAQYCVCSSCRGIEWQRSDLICCSTATIPNFFWLGSFWLTLSLIRLAQAPRASCHCWAVNVAFTAWIQYFCDSMWDLVRLLKLISSKKMTFCWGVFRSCPCQWLELERYLVWRLLVEIPIGLVVERYVAEDPLRMCDVKNFWDELLCPVGSIKKAARHG